jgi:hypothetical protein
MRSLEDHVRLGVLVVAEADQHDVARVDPHLVDRGGGRLASVGVGQGAVGSRLRMNLDC